MTEERAVDQGFLKGVGNVTNNQTYKSTHLSDKLIQSTGNGTIETPEEQFPFSSVSYSNTPTRLLRFDSFPPSIVEGTLRNIEPRKLTFPGPVNLPIP